MEKICCNDIHHGSRDKGALASFLRSGCIFSICASRVRLAVVAIPVPECRPIDEPEKLRKLYPELFLSLYYRVAHRALASCTQLELSTNFMRLIRTSLVEWFQVAQFREYPLHRLSELARTL